MNTKVFFEDLGRRSYKEVWNYQEELLQKNVAAKMEIRNRKSEIENRKSKIENGDLEIGCNLQLSTSNFQSSTFNTQPSTLNIKNYLLFVEHNPVYTLGTSGKLQHVLISEKERNKKGIEYFHINRGGDITFHGPGQIVGYPIFDLEQFKTDVGWYLRSLEEVIILTMAEYGLKGERSAGETGVWLDANAKGKERKICAMGIRCSRWITMHGFAFNVNTDLNYFNYIIPCGIQNKQVTSLKKELGFEVNFNEVKQKLKRNFEKVFEIILIEKDELLNV
ncbi:MAG: lipoyl(octanoyl) transferase LipB [Chitinophagaceae bacterium]